MKSGANFEDRNAIRRWAEAGQTASFISEALKIDISVVEKFMPKAQPQVVEEDLDDED